MTEFQLLGFYICAVGSSFYPTSAICLYVEMEAKITWKTEGYMGW